MNYLETAIKHTLHEGPRLDEATIFTTPGSYVPREGRSRTYTMGEGAEAHVPLNAVDYGS